MMPNARTKVEYCDGLPVAVIVFDSDAEVMSSCIRNGGMVRTKTIAIMQVESNFHDISKNDADDVVKKLKLPDDTVVFMTAAEVDMVMSDVTEKYKDNSARAISTAGLSNQVVAGDELVDWETKHEISSKRRESLLKHAGTINIIGISDVPLSDSAKVNAVIAMTEAKSAAMHDLGFAETGTTSDAVAIVSPIGNEKVTYCGTGLGTGLALSRAVRTSVRKSLMRRGDFPYDMTENDIEKLRKRYSE